MAHKQILIVFLLLVLAMPVYAGDPQSRGQAMLALQASVALQRVKAPGATEDPEPFCGGVTTDVDKVLTAYHCSKLWDTIEVVAYSGERARVLKREPISPGWDLAVLVLDRPFQKVRVAQIDTDVAPGDPFLLVGSTDGEPFTIAPGIVSKVLDDAAFAACNEDDKFGHEEHQILQASVTLWGGNSGGGAFSPDGKLIGITTHMRISGHVECVPDEKNPGKRKQVVLDIGGPLWAWLAGPATLQKFLAGNS